MGAQKPLRGRGGCGKHGELLSCVLLGTDHSGQQEWQPSMAPTAWAGAQVPRRDLDPECEDLWARMQEAGPPLQLTPWHPLDSAQWKQEEAQGWWETHQRIR